MKHNIKKFAEVITHGRTRDLLRGHVKGIDHTNEHVVIYVDNAGPMRELGDGRSDEQIKKAVEQVCGENCTYELKLYKANVQHEREKKISRRIG
ncbi:MAG TPA: hypothetical protein EYG99_00195 [Candidatus Pacebacteria bacterium]|nr:hypothetical protein [Candidatus Paceibacterota bacterium]